MQAKLMEFFLRMLPKNKIVANVIKILLVAGAGIIGYSVKDVQVELCSKQIGMESPAMKVDPTPTK